MPKIIIEGSEERINELKKYLSKYIKVKNLTLKDVAENPYKQEEEVIDFDLETDAKPEYKTTKKKTAKK